MKTQRRKCIQILFILQSPYVHVQ
uniref:Uncharacterized protein n=1 Tax=Arundo donax TaxID=35708 RepID=A0A0A8Y275_ARUDO